MLTGQDDRPHPVVCKLVARRLRCVSAPTTVPQLSRNALGTCLARYSLHAALARLLEDAWLLKYARNEHSQFGEDGIIAKALSTIGIKNWWCFEAGAWDGKHFSNTHALMKAGWSGVFVEANEARVPDLKQTYGGNERAHIRQAFVGLDKASTLDQLLAGTPIPNDFDFLSLDIDGIDYYVWESLSNYRPRLVVIGQ